MISKLNTGANDVTYLVRRIRTQYIEGWRNQLRLDRHILAGGFLPSPEGLFNRINPGGCVTRQLDVGTEFYRLRCESPSDGGEEEGLDGRRERGGERSEHGCRFAADRRVNQKD